MEYKFKIVKYNFCQEFDIIKYITKYKPFPIALMIKNHRLYQVSFYHVMVFITKIMSFLRKINVKLDHFYELLTNFQNVSKNSFCLKFSLIVKSNQLKQKFIKNIFK